MSGIGHLLLIIALPLAGQTKTQPLPSFDAASIKVDNSESHSSDWDDHPGRMTVKNATLLKLIERAYSLQAHQISGPRWLESAHYDIAAELPAPTTRAERIQMLQSDLCA
jgi:uncharacterized protein (TIGR03435 family)